MTRRTVGEAIAVIPAMTTVDLGTEVFTGSDFRPAKGVEVKGGVIDGPCHGRNAIGFHWESPRQIDSGKADTNWMFGMLGGTDWTITDLRVEGGQSLAQIQVGLDNTPGAQKIPMRWMFDGGYAINNGAGTITPPMGHNFYAITDTSVDMMGIVRNMVFGPSLSGHAVKCGGTGSNPLTSEGVRGIDFVGCHIDVDHDLAGGVLVQGGKTRSVRFVDLTTNRPILIDVNDGAQVAFTGKVVAGKTFTKTYRIPQLHLFKQTEYVDNGRPARGVSWTSA